MDPSERWTAKQAINHPFIKLYPKYFETPKNLQDFNENQETEEEEERELFQINKTMNQETRASSPPSKQDSIKQGSTALQKEESKEKKQPKSNKNHTRNWNSYTEFKVSNEFEDPPFLNQFAGCSLNQNDLNPSNNRKKSQEGQISGNKWLFGGPNDQKVQNIESIWQKPENNQYFQNVQNPNICQNAQKNTNLQNFQNMKTNFQNSQGLDQKADFQNSQIPDNLINAMNWQNIAYSQNSANFQNIVYPPNFQNMAYQQNPAFYQNMNYPPNQGYPQNPNFQNFENQFFENPHQAQRTSNIRDNQPQPLPNINLQDLFPNFQNQNYKNPQSNDLSFFLQQSMTSMQMQNQNQMYPPLNRSFSDPTNHQNFQTFQRNPNQMNPNFQYPPPFIDSNQNQSNLNLSYPHQLPNYNNPNQNFGSNAKFSEESKEKQGNFKSFVSKNRFPHPNYQVPNEIHEQEEDYGTPGVDIIPQFQNFGQKPVQSRFYSNQTQSEENKSIILFSHFF